MFRSVRRRRGASAPSAEVNMAPLIDMVFILLIFFLVTASFTRDTGLKVDKPQATSAESLEPQALRIGLAASGAVYVDGERLDLRGLRERVRAFIQRERGGAVVVIPDGAVSAAQLVEVIDVAKLAGARDVAIATRRRGESS